MTYLVTEACIRCKYMDCIEVCPVDCFYVGENMLVIHPDECIDCGVCEPECPVEAIIPDTAGDDDEGKWLEITKSSPRFGPTSRGKATRPATRTTTRTKRVSSISIFRTSRAKEINRAGQAWKLHRDSDMVPLMAAGRSAPGQPRRSAERPPLS